MTLSVCVLTASLLTLKSAFFESSAIAQVSICESCTKLRSEFDSTVNALKKIKDLISQNEAYLKVPRNESQVIKVKSNLMLLSLKIEGHEATLKADTIEMKSNECTSKCGTSAIGL